MPPAPNASAAPNMPPAPEMAPPSPAAPNEGAPIDGGMEDIKSQIAMPAPPSLTEEFSEATPTDEITSETQVSEVDLTPSSVEEETDSLFDLSDLELPGDNVTAEVHEDEEETHEYSAPNNQEHAGLGFIEAKKDKIDDTKPFFVTTSQFKAILEIIENVKSKTKESSQRHLRLMDIKSEEDIEYENMKKDFVYIEDKLYEVDSLLFED